MCCKGNEESTREFLSSIKPGVKYISGWKVLTPSGKTTARYYQYSPGTHTAGVNVEFYPEICSGIHFYLYPFPKSGPFHVVRIRVRPKDIVLVAHRTAPYWRGTPKDQAVATRIQIETREWKRAGLPMPQSGPKV